MNSVDQKSFQTFLANAFAVQESGLDSHSLSALIEIQRFMTSDDFDLDRAMQMVADRTLEVCPASGVAIALLEAGRNELVYKAGSGNRANDVGRRVPAVMSGSSLQESRREILRVENAETDKRIEAEVCRQFGATALLMLPICKAHVLTGVLQVLFDGAHSFAEREVRTYRLMAAALEEVILHGAQRQGAASTVEQVSPPFSRDQCLPTVEGRGGTSGAFADVRQQSALANPRYAGPAIAAAVVLTILVLISHLHHPPDANIGSSLSRSQHAQQRAPAYAVFANQSETVPGDEAKETAVAVQGFRRVRVGRDEVDYIAEDVTIRTFETRPAAPQIRRSAQREMSFGDDVTVRYFANPSAVESGQRGGSETAPRAKQISQ